VQQAEAGKPFTFNSVVLYSTMLLEFEGTSYGFDMAGEARAREAMSVGEGLHRICAWGVASGLATIRGVKRPEMSERARRRIEQASIPVIVIEEPDLRRQKTDFHTLNLQKPLSATVLHLTDETVLSDITRRVISDVKLFQDRIDLNNASVGARSDKLLAFAQLRFIVASYLLGKKTRSKKQIEEDVESLAKTGDPRRELREVFTLIATNLGGLTGSPNAWPRRSIRPPTRAETLLFERALARTRSRAPRCEGGRGRSADGDRAPQGGWRVLGADLQVLRRDARRPRHGEAALQPREHRRSGRQAALGDDEASAVTERPDGGLSPHQASAEGVRVSRLAYGMSRDFDRVACVE
jgi:hypothetical protein